VPDGPADPIHPDVGGEPEAPDRGWPDAPTPAAVPNPDLETAERLKPPQEAPEPSVREAASAAAAEARRRAQEVLDWARHFDDLPVRPPEREVGPVAAPVDRRPESAPEPEVVATPELRIEPAQTLLDFESGEPEPDLEPAEPVPVVARTAETVPAPPPEVEPSEEQAASPDAAAHREPLVAWSGSSDKGHDPVTWAASGDTLGPALWGESLADDVHRGSPESTAAPALAWPAGPGSAVAELAPVSHGGAPIFGDLPSLDAVEDDTRAGPHHRERRPDRPWRGRAVRLVGVLVLIAAAMSALAGIAILRAAGAAREGQRQLLAAERDLGARDTASARNHLVSARAAFGRGSGAIGVAGPLLAPARVIPLIRAQVKGTDNFLRAGKELADAGIGVSAALDAVVHARSGKGSLTTVLADLEPADRALAVGRARFDKAIDQLAALDNYRLIGPLGSTREELAARLPDIQARLTNAQDSVLALRFFAGAQGPRRYLVFTQNPDELRPTGGFIGTYGIMAADGKKFSLDRFASIESWYLPRPNAVVPAEQAPTPLQFPEPGRQTIANVNASADWPRAAELAMRLWQQGGEQPVDGVLSVTPGFLARLLAVVGPVEVPSFGEVINAGNLIERTDFYTHQDADHAPGGRKDFLVALAPVVLDRLLNAPASSWEALGQAVGEGFRQREAMAWSRDDEVANSLTTNRWDGSFPATTGDFFYETDFEYAAKNGRGLRRAYQHAVTLSADGSGEVTTKIQVTNTQPAAPVVNVSSLSYVVVYGPAGAQLDVSTSEEAIAQEESLAGHPAAGWLLTADPLGSADLRTGWRVPHLLEKGPHGTLIYRLNWLAIPDHTGDTAALNVLPPKGWRWKGDGPPREITLERDFSGSWILERR
jgi:hypothetical protein